jgi:hypothetical protein
MRRVTRIGILSAVFVVGVIGYSSLLFAAALARDGLVTVRIEERHEDVTIHLPLPGVVLEAGAAMAPWVMGRDDMAEVRQQIGAWGPLVLAVMTGLEEMPDATLVEVVDGGDHVRITKRGGEIQVLVDDTDDTHVEVTVPARALRHCVEQLIG